MKRVSVVERALEDIGWSSYHNKLFFNCCCGWAVSLMWMSTVANMMAEIEDLSPLQHSLLGVAVNTGAFVGCFVFPFLSDQYGRAYIFKKVIILTCFSSLLVVCSLNYEMLLIGVLLIGCGAGGDMSTPSSVMLESTPPSYKRIKTFMSIGFCIGPIISQIAALLLNLFWEAPMAKWRMLACIITSITMILAFVRSDMLESPIYLFGNRNDEFVDVIVKIARSKGRVSYAEKAPLLVPDQTEPGLATRSLKDIFGVPYLYSTVLLSVIQCCFYFGFTGILFFLPSFLHVGSMTDTYVLLIVQQASGVVGLLLSTLLVDLIGKKPTMSLGLLFCGGMIFPFLMTTNYSLVLLFSGLVYLGMLMGVAGKNVITPESYPPHLRGTGVGFVMALSRMAGIFAPVASTFLFTHGGIALPLSVFGVCFLTAGALVLFLPEFSHCN